MNKPSVDSSTFSIIRLIRPQHGGKLNASFDMLIQLQAHQSQPQIKDKNPFQSVTRMQLLYAIVATSVVWHVALHWIYKYIDLPPPFRHSIIQSLQSTGTCCPSNRKKKNLHFFQIYSPSMSFRASWAHLLHVYGAVFHRFLKADTWHLPLRETSSSTRFSKFCISGGRRPISLSLSPSFLRRCNLKKFCKHGEEKKKQDLDLSTTRTREPFANKSQWITTQLVRFRGHKSLGGCHLLVP